jgi:ADP-ribosylglycohydrolase
VIGAAAGDIIGSVYEHRPIKDRNFPLFSSRCRFTDDTVLTMAVARAILDREEDGQAPYESRIREFARRYPDAGYGGNFSRWAAGEQTGPYGSWGNGSAMRVSPVGFAFNTVEEVLREARRSAEITHNHPEGIKGAQAAALAVLLARRKVPKEQIRGELSDRFGYRMNRSLAEIRPGYRFDVSCAGTVPEAVIAFAESDSFEDAVRNAVSLGGDSDTLACITGAIAEAWYGGVPKSIESRVRSMLPQPLLEVLTAFTARYGHDS